MEANRRRNQCQDCSCAFSRSRLMVTPPVPHQDIDQPLGVRGMQLHEWLFATRSFAETVDRERRKSRTRRRLLASETAGGRDVLVGGGAATIRQDLRASLIGEMHIAIVPVLLGGGERLFDDLGPSAGNYRCVEHVVRQPLPPFESQEPVVMSSVDRNAEGLNTVNGSASMVPGAPRRRGPHHRLPPRPPGHRRGRDAAQAADTRSLDRLPAPLTGCRLRVRLSQNPETAHGGGYGTMFEPSWLAQLG